MITDGSTITLPGDIFEIADYDIIGWTTDRNNKTEVEYEVGEQLTITQVENLYALWVLEEENNPN